jgi:hypothetical protein
MTVCPNGHQNPDGPKFCGDCGAAIAAPPPACPNGHENPDGRKFCGDCGAAIVAMSSAVTPTLPPPQPPPRVTATLPPPPTPPPPAGWYPDPKGGSWPQYWDGQRWGARGAFIKRRPKLLGPPTTAPVGTVVVWGWHILGAAIVLLAVVVAFATLNIGHFRDRVVNALDHRSSGSSPSSESSSAQAGVSVDSFCTELRNLWDGGGVLQAVRDVDNAYRYSRGTPNATSRGDLQTAATNAQKLADDTPLGATSGGGDVKTVLTAAAKALSAAAAGHAATSGGADDTVIMWQGLHCP